MAATIDWTPQQGSAVVCVAVVMKSVISYTENALQHGGSENDWAKSQNEAEEKNVLLKYAWHDTSEGIEEASGIGAHAVRRLQEEVYAELTDPTGQWAQAVSKGITFDGLIESAPMLEHFWSRIELRMQMGLEVEEADGWMPLQPVMEVGSMLSPAALAEQSLVRWSSDTGSLATRLLHNPTRVDEQGRGFRKVQGWSFGIQKCIRVLYEAGPQLSGPGFQDLIGVSIAPQALETGQQGARWTNGDAQSYRIIAVVRLGSKERLRLYDEGGKYSVPKALSNRAALCLDDK